MTHIKEGNVVGNPEADTGETKPVKALIKEDVQIMAGVTEGMFIEKSNNVAVRYESADPNNHRPFFLELCRDVPSGTIGGELDKRNPMLILSGLGGEEYVFSDLDKVTFGAKAIVIESAEGNHSTVATIKPDGITVTQKAQIAPAIKS